MATVMTVLGPIAAEELGFTQPHEHLLIDLSTAYTPWTQVTYRGPWAALGSDTESGMNGAPAEREEFTASERFMLFEPVRLENRDWISRWGINLDNLRLLDVHEAEHEVLWYREAGGSTLVDSTPRGLGRDPAGLQSISRRTGVHVVMGCGWYFQEYQPSFVADATEDRLADLICRDVLDGDVVTGVRAGIIGEIGLSWPVRASEEKVLRAAARAQSLTGAALQIHPGRNPEAPRQALDLVEAVGGTADRVIMSHVDRTLFSVAQMSELAARGCYVELDNFGQESSSYPYSPIDRPNDATRIDHLLGLIEAGYLDRLLVSLDVCEKVHWRRYGGPGYAHLIHNVLPVMRRKGMSEAQIHALTVKNPAAALRMDRPSA
jgi:phosphotriesterase-related protein